MLKALIVDDEILAINLLEALLHEGQLVQIVGKFLNPIEALEQIPILQPDILFLDIDMADMNGIELASTFEYATQRIDIVFVTAYEHYALEAFNVQAADYILKPLDKSRLLKAIDRIQQRRKTSNIEHSTEPTIIGALHFHIHSGKVSINNTMLSLATKEFQILFFLAQHAGLTFPASELYQLIWDEDSIGQTQALRVHISNLRRKLEAIPGHHTQIVMERGQGYRLTFQ
ncbi:response regulator transcription factor [Metasolibacillus sp. FSL H7-0170]|uniref:response regulator transcription factor n=1 Tax=Metasolibacillus TaxID=2703677 RepID=UPI00079C7B1C|nr:response regulator transcription factor [Metasolibacillus fluoroglycofenilyticus]KYG91337.1 DNA-binding response regulator [[Bacillus] sp. KCTC 13219]